jgi:hypothetical protein
VNDSLGNSVMSVGSEKAIGLLLIFDLFEQLDMAMELKQSFMC